MQPKPTGQTGSHARQAGSRRASGLRTTPRLVAIIIIVVCASALLLAQEATQTAETEYSIFARLAPSSLLLDLAHAGGRTYAAGERGHILVSEDGGATWRQARVPTRAMLTAVHFHDSNVGWAVGHDSVILRTTDGGATWSLLHYDREDERPFLDVWFSDAQNGIAVGAYGRLWMTQDGGTTWDENPPSEDDDFHLNQIAAGADGRLYIAAESGIAYRSDDGGESWVRLDTGYSGSLFGILPLDGDSVLIFGLRGNLLRSDDAGESWTTLETDSNAMLNSGIRLADGRIVVAGLAGTLLVSTDGGRSFEIVPQQTRSGIQKLLDLGSGQLLLAGENGVRSLPVSELSKREAR
jgi:photosystem II stability/assembly factor-like uncharacterized protein